MNVRRVAVASALVVISGLVILPAGAQTRLHPDLAGVTTQVGKVRIYLRPGGYVSTSIAVNRTIIHRSNRGMIGVTYRSPVGVVDSYTYPNQRVAVRYVPNSLQRTPAGQLYRHYLPYHGYRRPADGRYAVHR